MLLQSLLAGLGVLIVLATAAAASAPALALAKPSAGAVAGGSKASLRRSDCWPVIVIRPDGSRVRIMRCA